MARRVVPMIHHGQRRVDAHEGYVCPTATLTPARLLAAGIDLSGGYPANDHGRVEGLEAARAWNGPGWEHDERGAHADKEKRALLGAAAEVITLSPNIGTEIVGLQLAALTDTQKDELALLVAERGVVFFRDQQLSPQAQLALGAYFGKPDIHPVGSYVPGLKGVSVITDEFARTNPGETDFRTPLGSYHWHIDIGYEEQPPGITHLHLDAVPETGGDTYWASGYTAYDKLSPPLQAFIDGLEALHRSLHEYEDPASPTGPKVPVITAHPLVRVHPATGWKALFIDRRFTIGIKGFKHQDGQALLNHLFDVYETSRDAQIRFRWTPGTSALWDNRVTIHSAVHDYGDDTHAAPRHGTRVSSLAERPVPVAPGVGASRRHALGLAPGKVVEVRPAF
ncbi:hypothetical protein Q8F55_008460 [Vanrija albida]|uniref:TauD/TfdA-like domain-containing protein n=1 Tax=Vanrija albida TaxID=181172 RepID=A0ABR3PQW5_9TREE